MQMVVICENFGWTKAEYLDQPLEFISLIKERMKIDAQQAHNANKKNGSRN